MKWYENVVDKLKKEEVYTHGKLIEILKGSYPYISDNSYKWGVAGLLESGKIVKVGYNQYIVPKGDKQTIFVPQYSNLAKELISKVDNQFPNTLFILIETALLNEFTEFHVDNVLFLKTNKNEGLQIFRFLQDQKVANLMYKPTKNEFSFLQVTDSVVIDNIVSETPLDKTYPHGICLETLLVDLFCDKLLHQICPLEHFSEIARAAKERYLIESPKLIRYARRRGKDFEMLHICPELSPGTISEMDYREKKMKDVLNVASQIVCAMDNDRVEFFDYVNYGKLSRVEIARLYNVTPQAIDNRINKLYKAVLRELAKRGYPESDVKKYVKHKNAKEFLRLIEI